MHYTIQGIITLLNFFLYWTKITLKETIVCVDCEPMIDRCNEVQVNHCIAREIRKRWIYFGGYDGWYLTLTWWKIRQTENFVIQLWKVPTATKPWGHQFKLEKSWPSTRKAAAAHLAASFCSLPTSPYPHNTVLNLKGTSDAMSSQDGAHVIV